MSYFSDQLGTTEVPVTITPTPSTNLSSVARAIYVGTGGNINILPPSGGARVIFYNVPNGILPVAAIQISNVDTTASNLVALT